MPAEARRPRQDGRRGVSPRSPTRYCPCGKSLAGMRSDARFCGTAHRVKYHLRRRPTSGWVDTEVDERTGRITDPLGHWTDIGGEDEWT